MAGPNAIAIDSMDQRYAAAEKVPVIDPQLGHVPSSAGIKECVLTPHICACPSMS
jgi:hypothetical protein